MPLRTILSEEHAELIELANKLLESIAGDAPDASFSATRWRLNHVLSVHLAKEDKLLYPSLKRSASATTRMMAERFQIEMGGLAMQHQLYCERWTIDQVQLNWRKFQQETKEILTLLGQRIRREEDQLYDRIEILGSEAA